MLVRVLQVSFKDTKRIGVEKHPHLPEDLFLLEASIITCIVKDVSFKKNEDLTYHLYFLSMRLNNEANAEVPKSPISSVAI